MNSFEEQVASQNLSMVRGVTIYIYNVIIIILPILHVIFYKKNHYTYFTYIVTLYFNPPSPSVRYCNKRKFTVGMQCGNECV